jgi:cold shock CspA family protein
VQGTVRSYDGDSGVAVLDDGTDVAFPATALSGLLRLHPGQRVQLVVSDGIVVSVTVAGER